MSKKTIDNGRQNFRIDDVIPFADEKLTRDEFDLSKKRISIRFRQNSIIRRMIARELFAGGLGEGMSPDMAKALEVLDAKLNYLIGVNMVHDAMQNELQDRPMNLSVSGACFVSDEAYEPDDGIRLTMMLPIFPPVILDLLGTVTRVEKLGGGRWRVALKFVYRCDEEEDTVARYVYQRHREIIRAEPGRLTSA